MTLTLDALRRKKEPPTVSDWRNLLEGNVAPRVKRWWGLLGKDRKSTPPSGGQTPADAAGRRDTMERYIVAFAYCPAQRSGWRATVERWFRGVKAIAEAKVDREYVARQLQQYIQSAMADDGLNDVVASEAIREECLHLNPDPDFWGIGREMMDFPIATAVESLNDYLVAEGVTEDSHEIRLAVCCPAQDVKAIGKALVRHYRAEQVQFIEAPEPTLRAAPVPDPMPVVALTPAAAAATTPATRPARRGMMRGALVGAVVFLSALLGYQVWALKINHDRRSIQHGIEYELINEPTDATFTLEDGSVTVPGKRIEVKSLDGKAIVTETLPARIEIFEETTDATPDLQARLVESAETIRLNPRLPKGKARKFQVTLHVKGQQIGPYDVWEYNPK